MKKDRTKGLRDFSKEALARFVEAHFYFGAEKPTEELERIQRDIELDDCAAKDEELSARFCALVAKGASQKPMSRAFFATQEELARVMAAQKRNDARWSRLNAELMRGIDAFSAGKDA